MRIDRLLISFDKELDENKLSLIFQRLLKQNYDFSRINGKTYLLMVYDNYNVMTDFILSIRAISEDTGTLIKAIEVPCYQERYLNLFQYLNPGQVKTLAEIAELDPSIIKKDYSLVQDFDQEILYTIKNYLEVGRSPSLTAAKLYVHRNTVTYRVERFKAKTGLELEINHIAIYIYRVLINYLYEFNNKGGNSNEEI